MEGEEGNYSQAVDNHGQNGSGDGWHHPRDDAHASLCAHLLEAHHRAALAPRGEQLLSHAALCAHAGPARRNSTSPRMYSVPRLLLDPSELRQGAELLRGHLHCRYSELRATGCQAGCLRANERAKQLAEFENTAGECRGPGCCGGGCCGRGGHAQLLTNVALTVSTPHSLTHHACKSSPAAAPPTSPRRRLPAGWPQGGDPGPCQAPRRQAAHAVKHAARPAPCTASPGGATAPAARRRAQAALPTAAPPPAPIAPGPRAGLRMLFAAITLLA